jgi:hypothetical protein
MKGGKATKWALRWIRNSNGWCFDTTRKALLDILDLLAHLLNQHFQLNR